MGSDESHFNVSVGSDGQSHKTVSTNHVLPLGQPAHVSPESSVAACRPIAAKGLKRCRVKVKGVNNPASSVAFADVPAAVLL